MYNLRGDGGYLETTFAGASRYLPGECGVSSTIYALPGGSGDATMGTGNNGRCTRRVRFAYAAINADGSTTSEGSITTSSFLNVRKLQVAASSTTPGSYIPIGGDAQRTFAFDDGDTKCGTGGTQAIGFAPTLSDGTLTGADLVNVHRDAADTLDRHHHARRDRRRRRADHPSRQGILQGQWQALPHPAALHHPELDAAHALTSHPKPAATSRALRSRRRRVSSPLYRTRLSPGRRWSSR